MSIRRTGKPRINKRAGLGLCILGAGCIGWGLILVIGQWDTLGFVDRITFVGGLVVSIALLPFAFRTMCRKQPIQR